jgi:outer membrane protein TolC
LVEAEDRLRKEIFAFDSVSDWTTSIAPTDPLEPPDVPLKALKDLVEIALRREPNVLAARLSVERLQVDVERRLSERGPKLDAFGNISANAIDEDDGIAAWEDAFDRATNALSWRGGLQFEMTLGNRAAKARLAEAELTVQKVAHAVARARDRRGLRRPQRRPQHRNGAAHRRTSRGAPARRGTTRERTTKLENQASTNLAVFQVEDQLNLRRTELVRAYLDARLALLDLPRVTGAPIEELPLLPSLLPPRRAASAFVFVETAEAHSEAGVDQRGENRGVFDFHHVASEPACRPGNPCVNQPTNFRIMRTPV